MEFTTILIGGIMGASIGNALGDPFRDSNGKFKDLSDGFLTWLIHVIIIGIASKMVSSELDSLGLVRGEEILLVLILSFITYYTFVEIRT